MLKYLWNNTSPARQAWYPQFEAVVKGDYDPRTSPLWNPQYDLGKQAIEGAYQSGKEDLLSSMPRGGGMRTAMSDLGRARQQDLGNLASNLSSNIYSDQLNKAWQAAFGMVPGITQGMGGLAGGQMAGNYNLATQQAAMDAQQRAGLMGGIGGLGAGIGSLLGASPTDSIIGTITKPIIGKMCCFIFIEANGGTLHPIVRRYRDEHMTIQNRRGYCWLADRLVPLMQRSKAVMQAVRWGMTEPMTAYGKWHYGINRTGWLFAPLAKAWLKTFDLLGNRPPYRRRGTEEVV